MHAPEFRISRLARAAASENRGAVGDVFGFDEEVDERGVGEILRWGGERNLGVTRDLELACAAAVVADRQAPHLDVVFDRDRNVELRRQLVVSPADAGLFSEKRDQ